jgi:hypothetical protein
MSWPIDNAIHIFTSLTDWLEKHIQITSQLHIMAPQTSIEPILVVELGGANGHLIEKTKFCFNEENQASGAFEDWKYEGPQWVIIPVVISLEISGSQGEIFAGRSMLASMCTTRFLFEGNMINIPIASINSSYTNKSTGDPVNFLMSGGNAALAIDSVDDGISFKYESPDENGGEEYKFIQTFKGTYKFMVSKRIYKDMRLNV